MCALMCAGGVCFPYQNHSLEQNLYFVLHEFARAVSISSSVVLYYLYLLFRFDVNRLAALTNAFYARMFRGAAPAPATWSSAPGSSSSSRSSPSHANPAFEHAAFARVHAVLQRYVCLYVKL